MKKLFRKRRYRKISTKMVASFLLACLLPLLVVMVVIYAYSASQLHHYALEFAEIFTSQIVDNLDARYDEYDRTTKSILYDRDILEALTNGEPESMSGLTERNYQIRRLLMKVKTLQPGLSNAMFVMDSGEVFTFNDYSLPADEGLLSGQDWFGRIKASDETLVFSEAHDQSYLVGRKEVLVVTVSRKIYDYRHRYLGILLMDVDADRLLVLSDTFAGSRNSYNIRIRVSSSGLTVYDSDLAAGLRAGEEPDEPGNELLSEAEKKDYLVYTQKAEKTGLQVDVVIPRGQLLLRVSMVRNIAVAALLIGILLVLLISFLLSGSISRPVQAIRLKMKEAEGGDYQKIDFSTDTEEMEELITSYNQMIERIRELIEDVYLAQIRQKNAQYVALQTQINPHMLYNTLEAIRMKAMMQGADDAAEMIKILSRMFRSVLDQDISRHTIADELDYARTYVQIQNIRRPDMFHLAVDVPEELYSVRIIPVVIQPVIENAVIHGFRGIGQPLNIRIAGERDENGTIRLLVSNDGKGMTEEEISRKNEELLREGYSQGFLDPFAAEETCGESRGIGLLNIRDRLKLYYGGKACIRFSRIEEGGLQVELCIPTAEEV